jgi:hypothetical protein
MKPKDPKSNYAITSLVSNEISIPASLPPSCAGRASPSTTSSSFEGLHCDFAYLLYSLLLVKLDESSIREIITDAIKIEREFIVGEIPSVSSPRNREERYHTSQKDMLLRRNRGGERI